MNLDRAIELSRTDRKIVTVEFDGEFGDLMTKLNDIYKGEITNRIGNDGSVDVFGCLPGMATGQMDWRLLIKLPKEERRALREQARQRQPVKQTV